MKSLQVKQLLFDGKRAGSHCLKLFDAVADSAAFYQFIKDKRFSGAQGQAVFTQQYKHNDSLEKQSLLTCPAKVQYRGQKTHW